MILSHSHSQTLTQSLGVPVTCLFLCVRLFLPDVYSAHPLLKLVSWHYRFRNILQIRRTSLQRWAGPELVGWHLKYRISNAIPSCWLVEPVPPLLLARDAAIVLGSRPNISLPDFQDFCPPTGESAGLHSDVSKGKEMMIRRWSLRYVLSRILLLWHYVCG